MTLKDIPQRDILCAAHRLLRTKAAWRNVPLWVFVRDLCGVGSTSANEICRDLGWDPNQTTNKAALPRW